jgi:ankyrin repeat protein
MRSAAALLALSLLAPTPVQATDPAPAPSSGRPLGIGDPREPERFTLALRYLQAARDGNRKTIEIALARGVPVDTRDDLGRSALLLATHDAGSLELVKLLHRRGAALDLPDIGGRAPISWAAADGRLEIARWLVAQGVSIERGDAEKRTPLFHAVAGDQRETVLLLLDHGASPNTPDRFGDTPLMLACSKGYGALAELLLRRGGDPSLRNQEGKTAVDRAAPGADACRGAQTPR